MQEYLKSDISSVWPVFSSKYDNVSLYLEENRRLPSPPQINSSVCLSVRLSAREISFNYSAENRSAPTDSVNKYVQIVNRRGIVCEIFFFKINLYIDSRKNQGNLHTLLRLKQPTLRT